MHLDRFYTKRLGYVIVSSYLVLIICLEMEISIQRTNYINKINILLLSLLWLKIKKRTGKRRFWVREIFENRKQQGAYHNLLQEMRLTDSEKYFNYLRMPSNTFQSLLEIIGPQIHRTYRVREPISSGERLALTLRYLASGDSMISLSYAFRIGASTVSEIINETCFVLWDCLHKLVLKVPSAEDWLRISNEFVDHWQLPHCIGAIDGKHVLIQAPPKSGSSFYNYKGSHSIVLLAVCDANYKFLMVDVGAEGRHSDGGIFKNSSMGRHFTEGDLDIPEPCELIDGTLMNYYIVADEAFPLTKYMMRPYPGKFLTQDRRIFNYRICRGRRLIENAFGILASRWRIYRKPIISKLSTAENIIKATVCLHNWLISQQSSDQEQQSLYFDRSLVDYEDPGGYLHEGDWRNEGYGSLQDVERLGSNMYTRNAYEIREKLKNFFLFDGAVPFQWDK